MPAVSFGGLLLLRGRGVKLIRRQKRLKYLIQTDSATENLLDSCTDVLDTCVDAIDTCSDMIDSCSSDVLRAGYVFLTKFDSS